MLFDLGFFINTILSCLFFFFLVIDSHLLVPAAIAKIFNPYAELLIPRKEAKAELEIHSVTAKAITVKSSN